MRALAKGAGAVMATAALSIACVESASPAVTQGAAGARETTGGSGGGGRGTQGGAGGAGVPDAGAPPLGAFAGAPPLPPLDVRPPSVATECDPELCVVASAWDVLETGVVDFTEFRLATASDTAYVTLTTSHTGGSTSRQRFVALDASGDHPIDQGPVPHQSRPLLAVGADGSPRVVGTLAQPGERPLPPVEEDTLIGTTWSRSAIENSVSAYGFAIDPTDRSRVHIADQAGAPFIATHEADGTWTFVPLPHGASGEFALDRSGQPVFLSLTARALVAVDAAGSTILSHALPEQVVVDRTAEFGVAMGQPQAIAPSGVEFGVALLLDSGLHVLLVDPARATTLDVPFPATRVPAFSCPRSYQAIQRSECVFECGDPCSFAGSGLASSRAFALARTADGAFWLGYVISELEIDYRYYLTGGEAPCVICGACSTCSASACTTCSAEGITRLNNSVLHVARIGPDGASVRDALTVPLGEFVAPNRFSGTAANGVRMSAFGQHVAVAVAHRVSADQAGLLVTTFDAIP